MQYEIYIDSLFFLGFLLNLFTLYVLNRGLNHTAGWGKILIGACIGGMGNCLLLFRPLFVYRGIVLIIISLIILKTVFKPPTKELFIRLMKQMLLIQFVLGGILYYLLYHHAIGRKLDGGILLTLSVIFFLSVFIRKLDVQRESKQVLYQITLEHTENKKQELLGLLDTGNELYEPISRKPVCILSKKYWNDFFGDDTPFRVIPFRTMGCKSGFMKGCLLDKITIHTKEKDIDLKRVYVCLDDENILSGKNYGMILHPALLKEKEIKYGRSKRVREYLGEKIPTMSVSKKDVYRKRSEKCK